MLIITWQILGFPFFRKPSCRWIGCGAPSGGQVPCFAIQAAGHCLCGEDIWNYSRQCKKGLVFLDFSVYPGTFHFYIAFLLPTLNDYAGLVRIDAASLVHASQNFSL